MFQKFVYFTSTQGNQPTLMRGGWTVFLAPGIFLLLLGIAILLAPELLAVLVASTFIGLGVVLIMVAFKTRSLEKALKKSDGPWEVL